MKSAVPYRPAPTGALRLLVRLALAGIVLLVWWATRQREGAPPVRLDEPPAAQVDDADSPPREAPAPSAVPADELAVEGTLVRGVTILSRDGRILFEGDVELGPTLARIGADQRLTQFPNDGAVFQNRERRLPRRGADYYREWVHLTPDAPGPGPQRVVTGAAGEAYYTPDHYESFVRIR